MGKIIATLDGSVYADSICQLAAWAADKTSSPITLLHVAEPHTEMKTKGDLSGSIGLGANSALLEKLTKLDEEHGRFEQKKGQIILNMGTSELKKFTDIDPEIIHRRGSLVEIIQELEAESELVIIGKRGEHHYLDKGHMGSNLEQVARSIHKPILVVTEKPNPITKFLLAYDGSEVSKKAIDYVINQPLLKGLECHLLKVGQANSKTQAILQEAESKLQSASINVTSTIIEESSIENAISTYVENHQIDLLVMGAYGHSKIRSLFLGSTTTALICQSSVPLLLIR